MIAPLSRRALQARRMVARLCRVGARARPLRMAPVRAMGLLFPAPLGLAAGFDRRGQLRRCAHRLGLGAIELGTLHAGHPELARLAHGSAHVPCGMSLGKPPGVPWAGAAETLTRALDACHRRVDYLTFNPGRDRPSPQTFADVVAAVAAHRDTLAQRTGRRLPLVVKLPPAWASHPDVVDIARHIVGAGADGLLISAEGAPSRAACSVLRQLDTALGKHTCLISVGGIDGPREARARLHAGAQLIQVHTGVAINGEAFIARLAAARR